MCGRQNQPWGIAGLQCFHPSQRTKAPAVSGLKSRKAVFRAGGGQVIAHGQTEVQEIGGDRGTDHVFARVFGARIAAAIPKEAGHGAFAAGQQ